MNEHVSGVAGFLAYAGVALAGYVTGDTVTIILGATFGALWAIGNAETKSRWDALILVVKLVGTALALTGLLAYLLETNGHVPATRTLAPIAFLISMVGTRWPKLVDAAVDGLIRLIGGAIKSLGKRVGISDGEDK